MSEPSAEDTRISKLVGGRLSPWQVKRARKGGRAPFSPLSPALELKHWQLVAEVDGPGNDPQVVLVDLAVEGFPAQDSGAAIRQLYAESSSDELLEEDEIDLQGNPMYELLLQMGQRTTDSEDYYFDDRVKLAKDHDSADYESAVRFADEKAKLPEIAVEGFGVEIYNAFSFGVGADLEAALLSRSDAELALDARWAAKIVDTLIRTAELHLTQGERATLISQFTIAWPMWRETLNTTLKLGFDLPGVDPRALRELLDTTGPDELMDDATAGDLSETFEELARTPLDMGYGAINGAIDAYEALTGTSDPDLPTGDSQPPTSHQPTGSE